MEKEKIARLALKNALTTGVFKQNILLFVEHHLDEVEPGYGRPILVLLNLRHCR